MQFVAACLEPGAIISEVARDAGVHVSQLFVGAKALQDREAEHRDGNTLVPVIVAETALAVPAVQPGLPRRPHSRRKRSDVTIELGRGRSIRVDSDIDTEALARILDCVMGLR